jgi:hypothetical protein
MKFRISRERVRQIEREVLKKARTSFNGNIAKLGIWSACSSWDASTAITGQTGRSELRQFM